MLYEFLTQHEDELIARCRSMVKARKAPRASDAELEHGIPFFLHQFIDVLQTPRASTRSPAMVRSATKHGAELQGQGFTVAQVIHDYGDLCQAITDLAAERKAPITVEEFGRLNLCLDDAIAGAATEFSARREQMIEDRQTAETNVRLGSVAHEIRNLLNTATLSFEVIKGGRVSANGSTGAVLDRSLRGLRDLVDRALAEVRLSVGIAPERIQVVEFLEEVELAAALEANAAGIELVVDKADAHLFIEGDRQILAAVLANLLQNAFKFTRANKGARVALRVRATSDRLSLEVEDECGGFPPGKAEDLFRPFEQRGVDRSGIGLGLTISRSGVAANDGTLQLRDIPGKGCVFTVDLPLSLTPAASTQRFTASVA